jgi:hypothetical protein
MTVCCAWCGRPFRPRTSGGSDQRFCGAPCRTAVWSAARRWVMRALEVGLLSTDVLKAAPASVHAVRSGFRTRGSVETRRHGFATPRTTPDTCELSAARKVQPAGA